MNPVLIKFQNRDNTAGRAKSPFEFEVKIEEKVEDNERIEVDNSEEGKKESVLAKPRISESEDDEDDSDDMEMLK